MSINKQNRIKNKVLSPKPKNKTTGIYNLEANYESLDLNRVQTQQKIREFFKKWNSLPTSMLSWNRVRDIADRYCNNVTSIKTNNWKFKNNQSKLIMLGSAAIYINNAKKTRCMESQQDVNNDGNIDKGMSSLDIAGAMIKHSKEVLNKFSDGNNMKKDKPKIMWSSSPLKNNRTKTMKHRNSPSKKANFKIPGLASYKKQPTQILMKKAINKTKKPNQQRSSSQTRTN